MKTQKSDGLQQAEIAFEWLRTFFSNRYFGEGVKSFWEGGRFASTLHVGEYTFTLEEVYDFLKHNASREQMFNYISYAEEELQLDRIPLSFHYYKLNLMRHK